MQELNPEILSSNKWAIIEAIAEKHQSPTELSEKTGTSLSNITQQLKLLEAYEIVKKDKSTENKYAGKPRSVYSINSNHAYAAIVYDGKAEKKSFELEGPLRTLFNILMTVPKDDILLMVRFHIKHEDMLKKCKAIGFIKSLKESIELFLITDHVDEMRTKFSNIFLDDGHGKTKKIINWTHNEFEVGDGLNKKDKYYMEMMKNIKILHDPNDIIRGYRNLRESL
jgi:predicted transcriptional regulator